MYQIFQSFLNTVNAVIEMFYNCDYFNGDINNWNISNVANMEDMFVEVDEEYIPKWYNSEHHGFFIRIKAEE